ncbi:hypothetical protein C9374_006951 [Naegleria lovaniensis]|uniref:Uncharacterized protein n=1 Tax=Naegleria lovaniensis TaxID=51637 RepID=A0AA88H2C9_NAELO|nr:uncharacterized protein C9374_006951 [Naegleria lovaniensis]KAG2393420.1 hypothetical protein C9374_006951 [Naegleria lovaniensis]
MPLFNPLLVLFRNLLWFLFRNPSLHTPQTKIILLFNTDTIRSIIGPKNAQELTTVSIPESSSQYSTNNRKISVRFNSMTNDHQHVVGQIDQNLLSFMSNTLLSHPIQSLVILRREKPDLKKRIEKISKTPIKTLDDQDPTIFRYGKSRAEREFLEERF